MARGTLKLSIRTPIVPQRFASVTRFRRELTSTSQHSSLVSISDGEHIQTVQGSPVLETTFERVDAKDLGTDDIVIAVMGPTGAGKSTFIRSASGFDAIGVSHSLKSDTQEVTAIKFWDQASGRHVVLVDTPGFDNTDKSDLDILTMISNWLVSSYDNKKLLSGVLYLHRITDNRMARTPLMNLRVFRHLCGKKALDKVYLTTTMWDEVEPSVGEKRLGELSTEYWTEMIGRGARIACCRHDDGSAKGLIRHIILSETSGKNYIAHDGIPTPQLPYTVLSPDASQEIAQTDRKESRDKMPLIQDSEGALVLSETSGKNDIVHDGIQAPELSSTVQSPDTVQGLALAQMDRDKRRRNMLLIQDSEDMVDPILYERLGKDYIAHNGIPIPQLPRTVQLSDAVQEILQTEQDNHGKILLIQDSEDMVELSNVFKETITGQQWYTQLNVLVAKQMELLLKIDKEKKAASDAKILAYLGTEYNDLRSQMDNKLRQMQGLKFPWLMQLHGRLQGSCGEPHI